MNLTNLVRQTGVEQNALGGRGFTRVHVGNNTDVAVTIDRSLTSHDSVLRLRLADGGLKTEVRESLVGFGHTVHVFTLLHRIALALSSIDDLTCQALTHGLLTTVTGVVH